MCRTMLCSSTSATPLAELAIANVFSRKKIAPASDRIWRFTERRPGLAMVTVSVVAASSLERCFSAAMFVSTMTARQ